MNKMKSGLVLLITLAFLEVSAFGQAAPAPLPAPVPTPAVTPAPMVTPPLAEPGLFGATIGNLYNLLYPIAIVYGIFQIVIAGYRIMVSEGEPKKLSEAKEHLTDSIVGIIFVILGIVILRIIIKSFLYQDVPI